jgi:hypothetical protein
MLRRIALLALLALACSFRPDPQPAPPPQDPVVTQPIDPPQGPGPIDPIIRQLLGW